MPLHAPHHLSVPIFQHDVIDKCMMGAGILLEHGPVRLPIPLSPPESHAVQSLQVRLIFLNQHLQIVRQALGGQKHLLLLVVYDGLFIFIPHTDPGKGQGQQHCAQQTGGGSQVSVPLPVFFLLFHKLPLMM